MRKSQSLQKKYFYLDDALREFNGGNEKRLNLVNEDGKVFLKTTEKKYDAILNDAFTGTTPAESPTTLETVRTIHDKLTPGGVYLSNIIGARAGEDSRFLAAEVNTISQVFKYVYIIPCGDLENEVITPAASTNNMVIASDLPLDIAGTAELENPTAMVLTDDYCPVDFLIPDIE